MLLSMVVANGQLTLIADKFATITFIDATRYENTSSSWSYEYDYYLW